MRKLSPSDPRVQPAIPNEYKEIRSVRLTPHRYSQLQAEVEDKVNDLSRQDIIDTALEEYFHKRYQATLNNTHAVGPEASSE